MTKKYIDADLLRKEIERLKDEYTDIAIDSQRGWVNANFVIDDLEQLQSQIDSLQQEQPEVDLEKVVMIDNVIMNMTAEGYNNGYKTRPFYEEVLRRFNENRK